MPPLAQRILADSCLPLRQRALVCHTPGLAALLRDAHAFECTEILPMALDLRDQAHADHQAINGEHLFQPAPLTWLEWNSASGRTRRGLLLDATSDAEGIRTWFAAGNATTLVAAWLGSYGAGGEFWRQKPAAHATEDEAKAFASHTMAMAPSLLALINSPRLIQQRHHTPHAGLQRRLADRKAPIGRYPLQAWHEVLLRVDPEPVTGKPGDSHLTGERALHFVRRHLRIIGGRLVHLDGRRLVLGGRTIEVAAHWRGNPANGIRQTRYRVTP